MLLISWQLKTTVCIILITSCWGQELFRVCERDLCLERTVRLPISNEVTSYKTNSNEGYYKRRLFEKVPIDSGMKHRAASDVTRHLNDGVDERREFQRLSNRDKVLRQLQREEEEMPLVNRQKENEEVLRRLGERERISAKQITNSREDSRLEDESYFTRRKLPSDRQNIIRDMRRNSKHTQLQNKNIAEESEGYEISERRILQTAQRDSIGQKTRQLESNKNGRSGRESEHYVRKEREENKRERNNNENTGNGSWESEDKTRRLTNREISDDSELDRRYEAYKINRRSEYGRESERAENVYKSTTNTGMNINSAHDLQNKIETTLRRNERNLNREELREAFLSSNIKSERNKDNRIYRHDDSVRYSESELQNIDNRFLQKHSNSDDNMQLENEGLDKVFVRRVNRISQSRERYQNREDRADGRTVLEYERKSRIETLRREENRRDVDMRQNEGHRLERQFDRKIQNYPTRRLASHHEDILQRSSIYERKVNMRSINNQLEKVEPFESYRHQNNRSPKFNGEDEVEKRIAERQSINNQGKFRLSAKQHFERKSTLVIMPETTENDYGSNHYLKEVNIQKLKVMISNGFMALGQCVTFSYVIMKTLKGKNDSKNHFPFELGNSLKGIIF